MSSEVETKDDVREQQQKKPLKEALLQRWQLGIKLLELLICAACMGFIHDPALTSGLGKSHMVHVGIMYTAFTGYMVINCVLILGRWMGDSVPYKTVALFALVGASLFLITCILLTVDRFYLMKHYFYHPNMHLLTMMTTSIVFAFINVVVFSVDALFTYIRKEDFA
ncbi:uncharacterized protein LOC114331497 [Diabrotica virgifera virgifera]|uniref:Uncharacterized protein LOC114331497 n=1 Tax=Diabrotica virgifera virgifera TaxID=50390 RepID=A0A6P7FQ45_DIAVI|nr:uncharacterized protein LOC114331497 [Diabrotica virgifera virgifera]